MKQNTLLIFFFFASFVLVVASSTRISVRRKGGNYNAKALMSTAKRRGRIIRCCGFSKCDPSLTGNRTNNGRPKPPRNNKTASSPGNRNSKGGAAVGDNGATLANKNGSVGGAPSNQGGASADKGGIVGGSVGSPNGAASAATGGSPGTSGASGPSGGEGGGGVVAEAASGGSQGAATGESAKDESSGTASLAGTGATDGSGTSGTGASGTGTSGTGMLSNGSGMSATSNGTGASGTGTSGNGTSGTGASGNGTSGTGTSGNGTSVSGASSSGTSANGTVIGVSTSGANNSTTGSAGNSTTSGSGTFGNTSSGNMTSSGGNSTASGGNGTASANGTSSENRTLSANATASASSNSSTDSNSTTISARNGTTTPSMFARRRRRGSGTAATAPISPSSADGSFSRACNSTFFFGSNPVSWSDSYAACQKFGMVSIGIGKPEKQKCVSDAAKSNPKSSNQSFWTSTHKKNTTCPKTYAMCDVNEVAGPNITELLSWASDMAGTDSETCVFLALMAGSPNGLANAFCNKQLNIMCEPKCKKPDCPTTCTKDNKLFDANGVLKNINLLGTWLTAGSTKYLFTLATGTWKNGWDYCCSIGMKLAGFETQEKSKELLSTLKGQIIGVNYWISLTQINCVGTWSFCKNETILENSIRWSAGQPDNGMGNQHFGALYYKSGAAELEIVDKADVTPFPFLCEQPV